VPEQTLLIGFPGLVVISETNARGHWRKAHKRHADQQAQVRLTLSQVASPIRDAIRASPRLRVTFIRHGGRRMDRSNLPPAFKWVEDAVSKWCQMDDGDPNWDVRWEQQPGGPRSASVEIVYETCEPDSK
jgi:hypothetical protein